MINLFGSPAGRAINEITSIKLNKSELKLNDRHQNASTFLNDQQNRMFSSHLASIADKSEKCPTLNSNLVAKKVKFWKFLEEDKLNNNLSTMDELAAANSTNQTRWVLSENKFRFAFRNYLMKYVNIVFSSKALPKQKEKSSTELYQEAADMLGLSCTLSDNCRCLDCQVRIMLECYFVSFVYFLINFIVFFISGRAAILISMTLIRVQ